MKTTLFSLAAALLGTQLLQSAVIPVYEDTYSTNKGVVTKAAGKASGLVVSGPGVAYLRFNVAGFSGMITPASVSRARLVMYVKSVQRPGEILVCSTGSEWTENAASNFQGPSWSMEPVGTISPNFRGGQFLTVDVTYQVQEWLASPGSDFGFTVCGPSVSNLQLGSKEGASTGHSAWLEIDQLPPVSSENLPAGIDAGKLGDGNVTNVELARLAGVRSPVQSQLDGLAAALDAGAGKVSRSGDTMTGDLSVQGEVKLGTGAALYAPGGEESLRMVRGTLLAETATGPVTLQHGRGFTAVATSATTWTLTFDTPFSSPPTLTASPGWNTDNQTPQGTVGVTSVTATGATISCTIPGEGLTLHVIAIGPR